MSIDLMDIFYDTIAKGNPREALVKSINAHKEAIIELNRTNLLRGRDSSGIYLSPKYSEDPYFKKPGAAQRYANWKAKISPATDRPKDVPNLFINGKYHRAFKLRVDNDGTEIFSDDSNSFKIELKFGEDKIYGLPDDSLPDMEEIILPDFLSGFQKQLS